MRARTLLALLLGCTAAVGSAETLVIHGHVVVAPSSLARPHRGETMQQVKARFGAPERRYPTVGKPPITRWDYPGFSVFFEFTRVVHSVVHAPHLRHKAPT